ncbi:MAG: TetR/AcrR family transcriptional regulator [Woeseiaceae bacterium]
MRKTQFEALSLPVTPKGRKTRASILDAARRIVAKRGFVAMRVGDVAKEAGLSLGAFYRYFENKDEMFSHLIADIHEELFVASRATENDLKTDPYAALREANYGYLKHYSENRDIMRALFEAVTVDKHYRAIWWKMRERHVARFVHTLEASHGITEIDGSPVRIGVEAMVSMTEQSAYCWFAQGELNDARIPLDVAAETVSRAWFRMFFAGEDGADNVDRRYNIGFDGEDT